MTVSVFDHPFLSGLLGDEEIAAYFSAAADIRAILSFEAALATVEARHDLVSQRAAERIAAVCATFTPDMPALKKALGADGVVIPDLVKQLRTAVGGDDAKAVHLGATSQDAIDTSLMMRMKSVAFILTARLSLLIERISALDAALGKRTLMGHTRMQAAIPITVADRLGAWRAPLIHYREQLTQQGFPLQFGGAGGTLDKLGGKGADIRAALAQELGLSDAPQWQSQRAFIAEIANLLSLMTGSLGKIGQDIALLAQAGNEIILQGGGSSSAMPHKQNPVAAETLVSLARFNAVQLSGIHQSMVHEQERSGAAWTLEWMILPQMAVAAGASTRTALQLLKDVKSLGRDDA